MVIVEILKCCILSRENLYKVHNSHFWNCAPSHSAPRKKAARPKEFVQKEGNPDCPKPRQCGMIQEDRQGNRAMGYRFPACSCRGQRPPIWTVLKKQGDFPRNSSRKDSPERGRCAILWSKPKPAPQFSGLRAAGTP